MQPGGTYSSTIRRRTIASVPSLGKALADFTIGAYYSGVLASVAPAISYVGVNGIYAVYKIDVVVPAGEGVLDLTFQAANGTDIITPGERQVEIEAYDLSALAAIFAVPIVSVVTNGGPQGDISIRVVANRYSPVAFTVRDTSGAAFDLSGWNNAKFGVQNAAQSVVASPYVLPYLQTTGITMTAGGLVTIAIPETASFFGALTAALITAGTYQTDLYWELFADDASDTAKTRCLARGLITILRAEG